MALAYFLASEDYVFGIPAVYLHLAILNKNLNIENALLQKTANTITSLITLEHQPKDSSSCSAAEK